MNRLKKPRVLGDTPDIIKQMMSYTILMPAILQLIRDSYLEIIAQNDKCKVNSKFYTEEERRDILVNYMRQKKVEYGILFHITSESQEMTNGIGYIDIRIAMNYQDDKYYSFECKRFLKRNSGEKSIEKAYIKDGLDRYLQLKYSKNMNEAGMISFIEEGDKALFYSRLRRILSSNTIQGTNIQDCSIEYNHDYIILSKHNRCNGTEIDIYNVILDFCS